MATLSYPTKLTQFGYASYLEITSYQYNIGLDKAAQNKTKDISGNLRNGGAAAGLVNGFGNLVASAYNTGTANVLRTTGPISRGTSPASPAVTPGAAVQGTASGQPPDPNLGAQALIQQIQQNVNGNASIFINPKENSDATVINLPLPNEFQASYGAQWDNSFKLGTLALLFSDLDSFAKGGALTATLGGVSAAFGQFAQDFLNTKLDPNPKTNPNPPPTIGGTSTGPAIQAGINGAIQGLFDPFGINSALGFQGQGLSNVLGLAGLAPNENAIQFFKSMNFREFDLSFDMFANNDKEQKEISKISRFMKIAMHPRADKTGTGGVLGFPNVFVLTPKFIPVNNGKVEKPIRHPELPGTKLCALTRCSFNYSPMNNMVTTQDGKIPYMTMKCTFTEITALSQTDFAENTNEGFQGGLY